MIRLDNLCRHCARRNTDCPKDTIGTTYCTDYRPKCQAVESPPFGTTYCVRCNLTWDMNDPDRPACLSNKELGQTVIAEIKIKFDDVNCELCGTWERNLVEGCCKECREKHYDTYDVSPFLDHLQRVLSVQGDRDILLAYMAACIQYKGVKFQWTPLIQGVEGNGKTLFTRCVAAAIGADDAVMLHMSEIMKHPNMLFIGVENTHVSDHEKEVLKLMITSNKLYIPHLQVAGDNFANFILTSNHIDAVRKTYNDRRFCTFHTAQQSADDVKRDGMGGDYFPNLYNWLDAGGYAHVANYLATYAIPDALNPAGACHRAPTTSSTEEAVTASIERHGTCECGGGLLRGYGFCSEGFGAYKVCTECLKITGFEADVG